MKHLIVVLFAVLATSCSGSSPSVLVKGFRFQPKTISVRAGSTVEWHQDDNTIHTITSGVPRSPSGLFDHRDFGLGDDFSFSFTEPGTYPYFCDIHHSMRGQVRVR